MKDYIKENESAWDKRAANGDRWSTVVSAEEVAQARKGDWHIIVTPEKPVPRSWFPETLAGKKVLCLASGGGQQGPILAAAGADVTVFDNSTGQLEKDQYAAQRDGLEIKTVQGNMQDLSAFADASFDLIVHPCSNFSRSKIYSRGLPKPEIKMPPVFKTLAHSRQTGKISSI